MPAEPDGGLPDEARQAILGLLERRRPDASICPSEAARLIAPDGWREAMPQVHDAVDRLTAAGEISLTWKGKAMDRREGPYRIAKRRP